MDTSIRYFIADAEKEILYTYSGSICQEKLIEFLNSLPKSIKEGTFPILNISRINGKITCNLERYFKSENIINKYYNILEYRVDEEDVDDIDFLKSEDNCSTNAYNIYIKWEEYPETEIINYLCRTNTVESFFFMDFSTVYKSLTKVSSSEEHAQSLLQKFKECFEFSEIDQISFHEVQFILEAEQYQSLQLQNIASHFRIAFEEGRKNYQVFYPELGQKNPSSEIIPLKSKYTLSIERMKNEENALGRHVNAIERFLDMEKVFQQNRSFSLNCISDEGDLYTYQVFISFPLLYEFMTYVNQNYKVIKEKVFEELDWDCYENKPILSKVLDKNIIENNSYHILNFDVKKENIHIRIQKAETVYVKWEESVDLIQYINGFISSLVVKAQADWSNLSKQFDTLPVNEQEKKQLYYAFFRCFQFGEPIEVIPSNIILTIENYSPHPTFSLQFQKSILKQKKELGIHNKEFLKLLLENGIVNLPKRLSKFMDC